MIKCIGIDLKVVSVTFTESQDERNHHLEIKARNKHAGGKTGDYRFIDIYGNYGKSLHDKGVVKEGDIITFSYEDKRIQKADKDTGKLVYKNVWSNVTILNSETPEYKPNTNPHPQSTSSSAAYASSDIDTETF